MLKITFMGAGSTVFAKNVLGDCMLCESINKDLEIALYDIDGERLDESYQLIDGKKLPFSEKDIIQKAAQLVAASKEMTTTVLS